MKTWKHFTFLTVLAVFGVIIGFSSCADNTTKFEGTWEREDNRYFFTFNKNNVLMGIIGGNPYKGTFTFTENELQISVTHIFNNGKWVKEYLQSVFKYTLIGDDTLIIDQKESGVDSIYIGTYKK